MSKDFLTIEHGPQAGREVPLSSEALIFGRTDLADVVIDHPGISRRHMQISPENDQYVIVDMGSTNGTWVNGERLTGPQVLADGEALKR